MLHHISGKPILFYRNLHCCMPFKNNTVDTILIISYVDLTWVGGPHKHRMVDRQHFYTHPKESSANTLPSDLTE